LTAPKRAKAGIEISLIGGSTGIDEAGTMNDCPAEIDLVDC
jgi:hypothetical protein